MRFMFIITSADTSPPSPEFMEAMDKLANEEIKAGRMIDTGGLMPMQMGARVALKAGKLNLIDGPFVEAKEMIGGYAIFVVVRRVLPRAPSSVVLASGIAAAVSVVISALAFTVEYAVGGTGTASVSTVAGAMVGVHVLIGIGEGVITGLVVGSVLAVRPDLVRAARPTLAARELEIKPGLAATGGAA